MLKQLAVQMPQVRAVCYARWGYIWEEHCFDKEKRGENSKRVPRRNGGNVTNEMGRLPEEAI